MRTLFPVLAVVAVLIGAVEGFAQGITDADIERTATMLRSQGQSEEQIQAIIANMKMAQTNVAAMESMQSTGMSEQEAAQRVAGFSDEDVAKLTAMEQGFAAQQAEVDKMALQREIAQFRADNAAKPDAMVVVDGVPYTLKVFECVRKRDTFSISAEGEPTRPRHRGPRLNAGRSGPFAGGDGGRMYYIESLQFSADGVAAGLGQSKGRFEGDRFVFDGMSASGSSDRPSVPFRVDIDCS